MSIYLAIPISILITVFLTVSIALSVQGNGLRKAIRSTRDLCVGAIIISPLFAGAVIIVLVLLSIART